MMSREEAEKELIDVGKELLEKLSPKFYGSSHTWSNYPWAVYKDLVNTAKGAADGSLLELGRRNNALLIHKDTGRILFKTPNKGGYLSRLAMFSQDINVEGTWSSAKRGDFEGEGYWNYTGGVKSPKFISNGVFDLVGMLSFFCSWGNLSNHTYENCSDSKYDYYPNTFSDAIREERIRRVFYVYVEPFLVRLTDHLGRSYCRGKEFTIEDARPFLSFITMRDANLCTFLAKELVTSGKFDRKKALNGHRTALEREPYIQLGCNAESVVNTFKEFGLKYIGTKPLRCKGIEFLYMEKFDFTTEGDEVIPIKEGCVNNN